MSDIKYNRMSLSLLHELYKWFNPNLPPDQYETKKFALKNIVYFAPIPDDSDDSVELYNVKDMFGNEAILAEPGLVGEGYNTTLESILSKVKTIVQANKNIKRIVVPVGERTKISGHLTTLVIDLKPNHELVATIIDPKPFFTKVWTQQENIDIAIRANFNTHHCTINRTHTAEQAALDDVSCGYFAFVTAQTMLDNPAIPANKLIAALNNQSYLVPENWSFCVKESATDRLTEEEKITLGQRMPHFGKMTAWEYPPITQTSILENADDKTDFIEIKAPLEEATDSAIIPLKKIEYLRKKLSIILDDSLRKLDVGGSSYFDDKGLSVLRASGKKEAYKESKLFSTANTIAISECIMAAYGGNNFVNAAGILRDQLANDTLDKFAEYYRRQENEAKASNLDIMINEAITHYITLSSLQVIAKKLKDCVCNYLDTGIGMDEIQSQLEYIRIMTQSLKSPAADSLDTFKPLAQEWPAAEDIIKSCEELTAALAPYAIHAIIKRNGSGAELSKYLETLKPAEKTAFLTTSLDGKLPLYIAAEIGNTSCLNILLQNVVQADNIDRGWSQHGTADSAFTVAARKGHTEAVKAILATRGVTGSPFQRQARDVQGRIALHYIAEKCDGEAMLAYISSFRASEYYPEHFVSIDNNSDSPLHAMMYNSDPTKIINTLTKMLEHKYSFLSAKSTLDTFFNSRTGNNALLMKNKDGFTPIELAANKGHTEVVKFLGEKMVALNCLTNTDKEALVEKCTRATYTPLCTSRRSDDVPPAAPPPPDKPALKK